MSTYAWIIDEDKIADRMVNPPSLLNAVGLTGPRDASPALLDRLKAGEGRPFRLKDDDDTLCYVGRILTADPEDAGSELDFRPLDDFGMPNAGCTSIEYQEGLKWKVL